MVNLADVRKKLKKHSERTLKRLRADINEDLDAVESPSEWKRSCSQKGCSDEDCKVHTECVYTNNDVGEAKENLLKVKNAIKDELESRK